MANIKRLLNKKGWTGRELGQLELTDLAVNYKQALEGVEDFKPIIEREQLRKMINGITDRVQGQIYNGYLSIHEWISIKVNVANAQFQQALLQFRTLFSYISQAFLAEDVYRYIEQLPVIMTQKEYEDFKAERAEAYFNDAEDGTEFEENVFNLIDRCIAYYLRKLQYEPQKPNPLKAIRKKYIAQPVKSKLILSRWNEKQGKGYFTIEDGSGRRSDKMTAEEWKAAMASPLVREALDTPCKWHTYTDPPTDLTKWDIVELELLSDFYPADIDKSGNEHSNSNFTASMEDFYKEFKELADFALNDMQKKYFSEKDVKLLELPISEWATTISCRSLYEMNFYGEREAVESDIQIFNGNQRALYNGIAIIRPSDMLDKSCRIDERGYYVEPKIHNALSSYSLEAFFPEAEEYASNVETVEKARREILSSFYYLKGYDKQVDLVRSYFDVPELEVFKLPTQEIEEKIEALNNLVPILYKQINDTDYRDKELQARKMEVLKDIFPPLEIDSMIIPEKNIEAAQDLLKDFSAFEERRNEFDALLCIQPQDEYGEGDC